MAHGVRKVNEYIIQNGRSLIINDLPSNTTLEQWNGINEGTLLLRPSDGKLKYKRSNAVLNEWSAFNPEVVFEPKTITRELIKDYAINNIKLDNGCVNARTIEANSIDNTKIIERTIMEKNLKLNSFTGNIFIDNSIDGIKLKNNSIDGEKLINSSIDGVKLRDATLTNNLMAENSITEENNALQDGCVTEFKLGDLSVSERKIKPNSITAENNALANNCVVESNLSSRCVSESKLSENSITIQNNALSNGVVTNEKIGARAITEGKLAENSITANNRALASNSVAGSNIQDEAVTLAKLSADLRNKIQNIVTVENGVARIRGTAQIDGDVVSTSNDCTKSIIGFKVFNPLFRDFAEGFVASESVEPGEIVEVDRCGCVKKAAKLSNKLVGVISDEYALCLGATPEELEEGSKVAVGLVGRIHIKVTGRVDAGDFIVSNGNGVGIAAKEYLGGKIIGKALESKRNNNIEKILCLVQVM